METYGHVEKSWPLPTNEKLRLNGSLMKWILMSKLSIMYYMYATKNVKLELSELSLTLNLKSLFIIEIKDYAKESSRHFVVQ